MDHVITYYYIDDNKRKHIYYNESLGCKINLKYVYKQRKYFQNEILRRFNILVDILYYYS